ncbi:hypothetical protein L6164_000057 [Bauhinia variegata]|uniref:Uncharacterized protein n=1 Tax=Bauhinia variegata TaxID=167791 RepID=A0ACB9Q5A1_BAUVA|nr:hypothetical protein L6164_000057 [Bauhinia variegata]
MEEAPIKDLCPGPKDNWKIIARVLRQWLGTDTITKESQTHNVILLGKDVERENYPDIPEAAVFKQRPRTIPVLSQTITQVSSSSRSPFKEDMHDESIRKTCAELREAAIKFGFPKDLELLVEKQFYFLMEIDDYWNITKKTNKFFVKEMSEDPALIAKMMANPKYKQVDDGPEAFATTSQEQSNLKAWRLLLRPEVKGRIRETGSIHDEYNFVKEKFESCLVKSIENPVVVLLEGSSPFKVQCFSLFAPCHFRLVLPLPLNGFLSSVKPLLHPTCCLGSVRMRIF